MKAIVITGADIGYRELLGDFAASFREMYGRRVALGLIGYDKEILAHPLRKQFDFAVDDSTDHQYFQTQQGFYGAFTASKARLPELFPGFDVYCWVDADCWFCSSESLGRIISGATQADIAIHPEYDVHYWRFPTPNKRTVEIYRTNDDEPPYSMFGRAMVNSGVYAMSPASPVWDLWRVALVSLRERSLQRPVFFSDQIPLHRILHEGELRVCPLRATDNWQLYASVPRLRLDRQTGSFILQAPSPPYETIGILHLAGTTKDTLYDVAGNKMMLTYSALKKASADWLKASATKGGSAVPPG